MTIEFQDGAGRIAHPEFQDWRRLHPRGFFLTFSSKQRARLHAALCPHCGNVDWSYEDVGQSLTNKRKVCAESEGELLAWAERQTVEVSTCSDCLRPATDPERHAWPTSSAPVTAFTWGYWGWGNSFERFLEAAEAHEAARGFDPPVFADVRLRRGVRAVAFRDAALEKRMGPERYWWFNGLGNCHIETGEPGVEIKDPRQADVLLDFILHHWADRRRVLFFCACETVREDLCHRHEVAKLLLAAARARRVNMTVFEWPGGDPVVRPLPLTVTQFRRMGATIPLGPTLPESGLATLPWGSVVVVESEGKKRSVLTGPATFSGEWRLPDLTPSAGWDIPAETLAAKGERLRTRFRCTARSAFG